jgi:hypothetical protein
MLLYEAHILNLQIMQPWHAHDRTHTYSHSLFLPLAFTRLALLVFCTIFEAMVGWLGGWANMFLVRPTPNETVTQVCPLLQVSTHVFVTGMQAWRRWRKWISNHPWNFNTSEYARITRTERLSIIYMICSWWLSSRLTTREGILNPSKWLGSTISVTNNEGVTYYL